MEDQFWNLFRETGDPMGYLLYRAKQKSGPDGGKKKRPEQTARPPAKPPDATA